MFFFLTVLLTPPFPLGTVCVHCSRSVKTVCEREDCAFMEVAATDLALAATRMTLTARMGEIGARIRDIKRVEWETRKEIYEVEIGIPERLMHNSSPLTVFFFSQLNARLSNRRALTSPLTPTPLDTDILHIPQPVDFARWLSLLLLCHATKCQRNAARSPVQHMYE